MAPATHPEPFLTVFTSYRGTLTLGELHGHWTYRGFCPPPHVVGYREGRRFICVSPSVGTNAQAILEAVVTPD